MQSTLKRREGERVLAQCPQPSSDKIAVVNAQTTAIEFNRKLGAILHVLSEDGFRRANNGTHPAFAQGALMGGVPFAIGYAAAAVAALATASTRAFHAQGVSSAIRWTG